jgi:hypothetical protein
VARRIENNINETFFIKDFFTKCFPTIEEFAISGIRYDSHTTSAYCKALAYIVIDGGNQGIGDKKLSSPYDAHARGNYRVYNKQFIERFPDKEIFAVRTNHLWDDIIQLEELLGNPNANTTFAPLRNSQYSHGSENYKAELSLSPQAVKNLCCAFRNEMVLYKAILFRASNLPYATKVQTWKDDIARCGYSSFSDMLHDCALHAPLTQHIDIATYPLQLENNSSSTSTTGSLQSMSGTDFPNLTVHSEVI